jgi:hypothetical protein
MAQKLVTDGRKNTKSRKFLITFWDKSKLPEKVSTDGVPEKLSSPKVYREIFINYGINIFSKSNVFIGSTSNKYNFNYEKA